MSRAVVLAALACWWRMGASLSHAGARPPTGGGGTARARRPPGQMGDAPVMCLSCSLTCPRRPAAVAVPAARVSKDGRSGTRGGGRAALDLLRACLAFPSRWTCNAVNASTEVEEWPAWKSNTHPPSPTTQAERVHFCRSCSTSSRTSQGQTLLPARRSPRKTHACVGQIRRLPATKTAAHAKHGTGDSASVRTLLYFLT